MIDWLRGNPCGNRWIDGFLFIANCAVFVTLIFALVVWAIVLFRAITV